MTEQTNETVRKPFFMPIEFFLGTALGFLVCGWLVVASYGWAFFAVHILGAIVLFFAIIGLIAGQIRKRFRPGNPNPESSPNAFFTRLCLFLPVWLLCFFMPCIAVKSFYNVRISTCLLPQGWTLVESKSTVFGYDDQNGFHLRIRTDRPPRQSLEAYRQILDDHAWKYVSEHTSDRGYPANRKSYIYKNWTGQFHIGIRDLPPGPTAEIYVFGR